MSKRRKKRRGPAGFGSSFPFLGLLQHAEHAAAVFGGRTLLTEAQTPSASLQTLKEAISPPQNSRREHSFDVLLVKGLRMGINIIRCFMALLVCLFVCLFVCLLVLFVCLFVFFCVCSSKLLNHSTNFNWPQKQISSAPTMAPVDLLASGSC